MVKLKIWPLFVTKNCIFWFFDFCLKYLNYLFFTPFYSRMILIWIFNPFLWTKTVYYRFSNLCGLPDRIFTLVFVKSNLLLIIYIFSWQKHQIFCFENWLTSSTIYRYIHYVMKNSIHHNQCQLSKQTENMQYDFDSHWKQMTHFSCITVKRKHFSYKKRLRRQLTITFKILESSFCE